MTMTPGIRRELAISYDQALARVPDALKTEGFGVLTEIDVAATLMMRPAVANDKQSRSNADLERSEPDPRARHTEK